MEISYVSAPGNNRRDFGYGEAGYNIIRSLQRLGHSVPYDDKRSPVQINFSQPEWFHLRHGQYQIGYTPWESSVLPESWPKTLNACDEVWTTSPRCKEWFENAGINHDIKVFQHGIDKMWTPKERKRGTKLNFLHVGEPAQRKGGQIALDAFRAAFKDQDDVHLTIKGFSTSTVRAMDRQGNILGQPTIYNNVSLDTRAIDRLRLPDYYKKFDALIYPSCGEGFGLIPLEALSTGMPSVVTKWWCPYDKFILPLKYKVVDSPYMSLHGKVAMPDFDNLVWWYQELYDNFETYSTSALKRSARLRKEYDWKNLTENAFKDLAERF